MRLKYYPETDSLYIDLSEKPSVQSKEISEGVVLDYDDRGNLVGIDIDNASKKIELKRTYFEPASLRRAHSRRLISRWGKAGFFLSP